MRKHWWFKHWRLDDFSPNSPMLEPSKVSLHTVTGILEIITKDHIHSNAYNIVLDLKLLYSLALLPEAI